MGVGVSVSDEPVIPSTEPVDPSEAVKGIGAELAKLRSERQALNARLTQTTGERDALAKEKADLAQQIADAEAAKADAELWREHVRTENDKLKEANATALAALTPEQRDAFQGVTDEKLIAKLLTAIKPAAPAAPAAPYPNGGGSGSGAPTGEIELTTAEKEWVKRERPDLARVSAAAVRKHYNLRPGATPAK
jgi:hypothetical protein